MRATPSQRRARLARATRAGRARAAAGDRATRSPPPAPRRLQRAAGQVGCPLLPVGACPLAAVGVAAAVTAPLSDGGGRYAHTRRRPRASPRRAPGLAAPKCTCESEPLLNRVASTGQKRTQRADSEARAKRHREVHEAPPCCLFDGFTNQATWHAHALFCYCCWRGRLGSRRVATSVRTLAHQHMREGCTERARSRQCRACAWSVRLTYTRGSPVPLQRQRVPSPRPSTAECAAAHQRRGPVVV